MVAGWPARRASGNTVLAWGAIRAQLRSGQNSGGPTRGARSELGNAFSRPGRALAALRAGLTEALNRQQQLPLLAGSSLLLVGVGMMILPLWMMTRHSDAIAEVVSRLLLS